MEHHHVTKEPETTERQIELTFRPSELRPDEAVIERCRTCFAEDSDARTAYCLGWLMASLEGIAQELDHGYAPGVTSHLRSGLAAIVAYEQTATRAGGQR